MKKFSEYGKVKENAMVQSRMEQIYDDIEQAINEQLPIRYREGKTTKTAIPIEISPGSSDKPWSSIKFDNGDVIKDYEIIGLIKEGHSMEILRRMEDISNNSPITKVTAQRISEKFDGAEFRDFQSWLSIIEQNIQSIKNNSKKYW